jgi:hypothetical protein
VVAIIGVEDFRDGAIMIGVYRLGIPDGSG